MPAPTSVKRPAEGRLQGQGRPQRQPDRGRCRVRRRADGRDRRGRQRRRPHQGRRLLQAAQGRGQLPPGRPDPGHHRVRPDAGRHRLGLHSTPPSRRSSRRGRSSCPKEAVVAGYYYQAINIDAPHPAAARLWQEYLYSDEGQNLWLKGGARPVRFDAMKTAGTLDEAAAAALPTVEGTPGRPDDGRLRQRQDLPRQQLGQRRWLTRLAPPPRGRSVGCGRPAPSRASSRSSRTRRSSSSSRPSSSSSAPSSTGRTARRSANVEALDASPPSSAALVQSVVLSAVTALAGAVLGGAPRVCREHGEADRASPSASSPRCAASSPSSAASPSPSRSSPRSARPGCSPLLLGKVGVGTGAGLWLYEWDKGLMLVYLYFQIPLMLIVFLPAVEGLRPQWREATETLGGDDLDLLAPGRRPHPLPVVRRRDAPAVHQRLLRLRHGRRPRLPGVAAAPAADRLDLHAPRSSSARRTSARRWPWRWSSSSPSS